MRHQRRQRKFGRETSKRRALLRSLAEGLLKKGRIVTTEARAKELRPFVEGLITVGRQASLAGRRLLIRRLGTAKRAELVAKTAPRFLGRPGGYTRVIKLPPRRVDGSRLAMIEFVLGEAK